MYLNLQSIDRTGFYLELELELKTVGVFIAAEVMQKESLKSLRLNASRSRRIRASFYPACSEF